MAELNVMINNNCTFHVLTVHQSILLTNFLNAEIFMNTEVITIIDSPNSEEIE